MLNLVPSAFGSAPARVKGHTLAELLARRDPLPLDDGLRYATDIATSLRELHDDGRSHGAVDPAHVLIGNSTATLIPWERRGYPDPLSDLAGFGRVLFALLNGREPFGDELRLVPAKPPAVKDHADLRAAAMRLAERCLTVERETAPDLHKILIEIRLLSVMAKQLGAEIAGARLAPPPPQTVPFFPPQPLDAYAGKMPPILDPPGVPAQPSEDSSETRRAESLPSGPILKDVVCPKCKGYHVRLSRPRTRFERLLGFLGMGVYRCHRCFYRYLPFFGRKMVRKAR